jgi:flavin-dependent dehydrogenase
MLAYTAAVAGATVLRRTHLLDVARSDGGGVAVMIDGADGMIALHAEQVVDASGRSARLARALGAVSRPLDRLVAVSVMCELADGAAVGDTFVEAVAHGWWYVSPVPGHRRMVSLFTDAAVVRSQGLAEPSAWWEALNCTEHTVRLAREARPTSKPSVASASSRFLQPAAGDGWIAVGDAALAVDPLSSSGVSTALASARRATEVLTASVDARPGAAADYARWVAASAEGHIGARAQYYGLEERFADSPFWRSRRAVPALRHAMI